MERSGGDADDGDRQNDETFRGELAGTVASAAAAYGYTISLGGAIALATWGNAHIPAAGSSLVLVWGLLSVADGVLVWGGVGFVATSAYFLGTVLQRMTLRRLVARHGRSRGG